MDSRLLGLGVVAAAVGLSALRSKGSALRTLVPSDFEDMPAWIPILRKEMKTFDKEMARSAGSERETFNRAFWLFESYLSEGLRKIGLTPGEDLPFSPGRGLQSLAIRSDQRGGTSLQELGPAAEALARDVIRELKRILTVWDPEPKAGSPVRTILPAKRDPVWLEPVRRSLARFDRVKRDRRLTSEDPLNDAFWVFKAELGDRLERIGLKIENLPFIAGDRLVKLGYRSAKSEVGGTLRDIGIDAYAEADEIIQDFKLVLRSFTKKKPKGSPLKTIQRYDKRFVPIRVPSGPPDLNPSGRPWTPPGLVEVVFDRQYGVASRAGIPEGRATVRTFALGTGATHAADLMNDKIDISAFTEEPPLKLSLSMDYMEKVLRRRQRDLNLFYDAEAQKSDGWSASNPWPRDPAKGSRVRTAFSFKNRPTKASLVWDFTTVRDGYVSKRDLFERRLNDELFEILKRHGISSSSVSLTPNGLDFIRLSIDNVDDSWSDLLQAVNQWSSTTSALLKNEKGRENPQIGIVEEGYNFRRPGYPKVLYRDPTAKGSPVRTIAPKLYPQLPELNLFKGGEFRIVDGKWRVVWDWTAREGRDGDYDKGDPNDAPLLRATVFYDQDGEELEIASYCTRSDARKATRAQLTDLSEELLSAALDRKSDTFHRKAMELWTLQTNLKDTPS
jgi:hypothetical protein